jgi:hypothetical protein
MNLGFGLVFSATTGAAEAGISRISGALDKLTGMAATMGEQLTGAFKDAGEFLVSAGSKMIGVASSFEKSEQMLRFAFRDLKSEAEKDNIMKQVELSGLKTMQSTKEVLDMVIDIKRMSNINLFDPRMPKVVDATGKELDNMATLLADVAAGSEFGMRSVKKGLMGITGGNWGRVAMNLDPIAGKIDEYKKAVAGAKTETDKFIAVAPLLARDFGGAASGLTKTWSYYTGQLDDISEKVLRTFGAPMMNALKPSLESFTAYFVGKNGILLSENINKLDGIRNAFGDIAKTVSDVANRVGPVVKKVAEFVMERPAILKIAAAFAGVTGIVAGVLAGIIALKIAIAGIAFALSGLLTTMLPVVAAVGVLAGAVYLLTKAQVGGTGFVDTLKKVAVVAAAAYEGISNMNNGVAELSEKTMADLEKNGLTGVATKLIMLGYRVQRFFEGLASGFRETFGSDGFARQGIEFLGERVTALFETIGQMTGMTATESSDKWVSSGEKIAKAIGVLVGVFGYAFGAIITAIDYSIIGFGVVLDLVRELSKEVQALADKLSWVADAWDWVSSETNWSATWDWFTSPTDVSLGDAWDWFTSPIGGDDEEEDQAKTAQKPAAQKHPMTRMLPTITSHGRSAASMDPSTYTPVDSSVGGKVASNATIVVGDVYLDGEKVGSVLDRNAERQQDRVGGIGRPGIA